MKRDLQYDYRLFTSPLRVLPDFIIPGEAKCGTTALFRCLLQHPNIHSAVRKETNSLINHPGSRIYARMNYDYYLVKQFYEKLLHKKYVSIEASPEYLSRIKDVKQVVSAFPYLKIVILLRDPVVRACSDYQMMYAAGKVKETFKNIVDSSIRWLIDPTMQQLVLSSSYEEHSPLRYVSRGIYINSILKWLDAFNANNILIINSESLFLNSEDMLSNILKFIGLDYVPAMRFVPKRKGVYTQYFDSETVSKLYQFFRPYNLRLYEYIGDSYDWESNEQRTINIISNLYTTEMSIK